MRFDEMPIKEMHIGIFAFAFCLLMISGDCFAQSQSSPFQFARRNDVGQEIQIMRNQVQAIDQMESVCDARCQQMAAENFAGISGDAQLAFGSMPVDQQEQITLNHGNELREQIQFDMLDDIFADTQMNRFVQLWTQFNGLNGIATGPTSEAMGISPDQRSQLEELQSAAQNLTNECLASSNFTPEQKQFAIQNIQNVLIDQSINILENGQLQIFIDMCGEECQFDPPQDPPAGPTDLTETGSDDSTNTDGSDPPIENDPATDVANTDDPVSEGSTTREQAPNQSNTGSRRDTNSSLSNQAQGSTTRSTGTRNGSTTRATNRPQSSGTRATNRTGQNSLRRTTNRRLSSPSSRSGSNRSTRTRASRNSGSARGGSPSRGGSRSRGGSQSRR